jgi:hypothetical protein
VLGNTVDTCGQAADDTYAGIEIRSDRANVQLNTIRHGGGANQHQYGLRINSGSDNIATNNDLLLSGRSASFSNEGSATIVAAGNRT